MGGGGELQLCLIRRNRIDDRLREMWSMRWSENPEFADILRGWSLTVSGSDLAGMRGRCLLYPSLRPSRE